MTDKPTILVEPDIDFELTARLANESFGGDGAQFSDDYLKWKYEKAFGGKTTVIAAMLKGKKIGQAVILWQQIKFAGELHNCGQFVDLFIVPEHRSFSVVRQIYKKLDEIVVGQPDHSMFATPNAKSATLNTRLLKLKLNEVLEIRIGLKIPLPMRRTVQSLNFNHTRKTEAIEFMQGFFNARNTSEIFWNPESMCERLLNIKFQYHLHKSGPLLAITSSRTFKNIPVFLICGLFAKDSSEHKKHLDRILCAAAYQHRRPLYLYLGINKSIHELPGHSLPTQLRPSQMILQTRKAAIGPQDIKFDRFEAIDFDFA